MLTTIADALLRHDHTSYWDAPEHFRAQKGKSSRAAEREAAERRFRKMRNVGLW